MKRAYKVNHNYGTKTKVEVIGGEKPGRFYQHVKLDKRARNKVRTLGENIKLIKKIFRNGLIITWTIAMLACAFRFGITQPKIEKAEAQTPAQNQITELQGSYESAEKPAYTDEYDFYFKGKADEARKIANCESGDRDIISQPNKNGTIDIGRMQVNSLWLKVYGLAQEDLLNKDTNIKVAKMIYDRSGNFSAWKSSFSCHGLR